MSEDSKNDDAKNATTASLTLELTLSGHGLPVPPEIRFWVDDDGDRAATENERVLMQQDKDKLVWKGDYELGHRRAAKGLWIAFELRAVTIGDRWSVKVTNDGGGTVGRVKPRKIEANVIRGWLPL